MKPVCLLTGKPGTGKTSLIKQAISGMENIAGGFYTEEIRVQSGRQGFRIVTLDGQAAILAHIRIHSPVRVSKYGVDLESLEQVGIAALQQALQNCRVVVIDEIGRMELFSEKFKETVLEIVNSGKKILGTIMLKSDPWADALKNDSRVNLIVLTRANYDEVLSGIQKWLRD
jgi:nucleoside-triphosphatase